MGCHWYCENLSKESNLDQATVSSSTALRTEERRRKITLASSRGSERRRQFLMWFKMLAAVASPSTYSATARAKLASERAPRELLQRLQVVTKFVGLLSPFLL
jgi:hypothetical protein